MLKQTRELCDQCRTTIFNGHMVCRSCGFSVCIECFTFRNKNFSSNDNNKHKDKDRYMWPYCGKYDPDSQKITKLHHIPNEFIYVQFIPPYIIKKLNWSFQSYMDSIKNLERFDKKKFSPDFLTIDSYSENIRVSDEELTKIFEMYWHSKTPIVIKNINKNLDMNLWTPDSFSNEFGHLEIDLIDCRKNAIVKKASLKKFWDGFENLNERFVDEKSRPLILKLKDWPTTDDFKNLLPARYEDLMKNLPIKKFTHRSGVFNLASSLPDFFSVPDLGPKLYIAYSSADTPKEGTTNLHVDISDAVNLMIYVGKDLTSGKNNEMLKILNESKCNDEQINRFKIDGERPGALWHIFKPDQADLIRSYLTIRNIEKGKKIKDQTDPIHDQLNYIDNKMLIELKENYNVEVYTIIQFLGDAIFIPSGAPHQVRNLNSCIKVAGDFVTPQGVQDCLIITNQFRDLSERHANHQDKLQVKNIIYHSIKKCLSILNCP
ncbi:unnamed protein product [Brachionus calyciflorus]|uniref:JmjC domain-containing protein n=1 Tax=Brachionus calyciflorus TaxID=104777 RepID=A0A814IJD0_9BILA|nr:unnamed protein product [Brachionus calyciflorus]